MADTKKKAKRHPHGTQEWAVENVNLQSGCEHDCRYCYAKAMGIRFGRTTAVKWRTPVPRPEALEKNYKKRDGRIMFPSSHDITKENIGSCLSVLKKLLQVNNEVLIVMKPDPECTSRLCRELAPYKKRVLFRFTIGSSDDKVLSFWEPQAPSFAKRIKSLKLAHAAGFHTSVSCEPMLDTKADAVVKAVTPFTTDSIWLGKANHLRQIVSLNCPKDKDALQRADALIGAQSDEAIFKLYKTFKKNPLIRWKDSIKKVVGLQRPDKKGMDL